MRRQKIKFKMPKHGTRLSKLLKIKRIIGKNNLKNIMKEEEHLERSVSLSLKLSIH
tara:strand:- start:859 stop:1026 length:168 start_codon:yes stop_codon:yes gene_type:complete